MKFLLLVLVAAALAQRGQKIASLPGYSDAHSFPDMDSGYINLDDQYGKALFYVLVRSPTPNAPLLFWFQGVSRCRENFIINCLNDISSFFSLGPWMLWALCLDD